MSTPPKYPSTPHWPFSETVHRDDSVHTNPELFVGHPVVITEKMDGGNTCLYRGEVYARSVAAPSTAGWMAMVKKHHAWKLAHRMEHHYAIYGEDIYGVHTLEYDPVRESETFRVFAIRDTAMGRTWFEPWWLVEDICDRYGFLTVPVVFKGQFESVDEITEFFRTKRAEGSALGGECEGFVMRREHGFDASMFPLTVCKYVRPNHVQTDEHWTKNWKPCKIDRSG